MAEMFQKNNFTEAACRAYELRCYDAFGYEFIYSSVAARIIVAFPICLDAMAVVGRRRGQAFLDFFGEVSYRLCYCLLFDFASHYRL